MKCPAIRLHLAGVLAILAAAPAMAFSTVYEMASVGLQRETRESVAATEGQRLFTADVSAAFSFQYRDDLFLFTGQGGYLSYEWRNLDGQLGGMPLSAARGYVLVGDDNLCGSNITPGTFVDCMLFAINPISTNPDPANAISGIELTSAEGDTFVLMNILFGWAEEWQGTPDFLQGSTLPATLPPPGTGPAVIQFDFRNFDVPAGARPVRHTVQFDTAAIVPLPAVGWLLVPALGAAVRLSRRRTQGRTLRRET